MNLFRHYFGSLFRSLRWGAEAGVALAILTASTPAFADIAKPGDIIAGYTQLQWAQEWWKWAIGVPAPNNPLLDTTGANAGVNNNGPVFFVAGVNGSGTYARTFTVPRRQTDLRPGRKRILCANRRRMETLIRPPVTNA